MLDFDSLMRALARKRPVFHSEADFQHALAWEIHISDPSIGIRLEYRPPWLARRNYVDLWVIEGDTAIAVELKYKTHGINLTIGGEQFALLNQAAQDIGRYDFVKDIGRLEQIVSERRQVVGYAIILTNDHAYWNRPRKIDTVDAQFRIHEGRILSGQRGWDPRASQGTQENRTDSIHLSGSYPLAWRDYSSVDVQKHGKFRYALVSVTGE